MEHAEAVAQKNKRRGVSNREVHGAQERIRLGVKRAPSGKVTALNVIHDDRVCAAVGAVWN